MIYNGELLTICLEDRFPDTSAFAKELQSYTGAHYADVGRLTFQGNRVKISFSTNDESIEKHNHEIRYTVCSRGIPLVVNGDGALEIIIGGCRPDSVTFMCTGNEVLGSLGPLPLSYTNKHALWIPTNKEFAYDTLGYHISLSGSPKGAFGFSKLSLIELNGKLDLFWDDMIHHLLLSFPFWLLWYLLVAGKGYFEDIHPAMYRATVKWMPWLTGFYFVLMLHDFSFSLHAITVMTEHVDFGTQDREAITILAVGCAMAICLLVASYRWKKRSEAPAIILTKTIGKTLAYSMLIIGLLALINYMVRRFASALPPRRGLMSLILNLELDAAYAVGALCLFTAYFLFVFFKLFSFNRWLQVFSLLLIVCFAYTEEYFIIGNPIMEEKPNGISFMFPNVKLSESKEGTFSLMKSFRDEAYRYAAIPLVIAVLFLIRHARKNHQGKETVVLSALFNLFFCCYLVSYFKTFLLIPLTLLSSILLCRMIVVYDKRTRLSLLQTGKQLYAQELAGLHYFRNMSELRQSIRIKEVYRKRLFKGELLPVQYEQALKDLDAMMGIKDAEVVRRRMEFGPFSTAWKNGILGARFGLIISALVWIVYFKSWLLYENYSVNGLPDLLEGPFSSKLLSHIVPVIWNGMAGFCLGYFFPFVKGDTGWKKGAWLGAAIGIAQLPIIYLTVESPGWMPLVGVFLKHVSILMITGFVAFDLTTIRKIYGRRYTWTQVVDVMGWKNTITLGSLILAAIGAGISAWVSGHVQDILRSLLK
jgi:hypothetical protein